MKHLIVPVDFSKESMNGIELAVLISSKTGADIQLVYVQKKIPDHFPGSESEHTKLAKQHFSELIDKYEGKLASNVKLDFIIKKGKVYQEIVNQADAFEDSAIVVSTHGASGFEEFFMGSNAFRIVTATTKPVFTIRYGVLPKTIRQIILPIDVTEQSRQKVPLTAELARLFGSKIHLLTVSSTKDEKVTNKLRAYSRQVAEYLKDHGVPYLQDSSFGTNVPDKIIEYTTENNGDLISIMSEQGTNITNVFLGSYAQQMLNKAPVPVLCITPKELKILDSFKASGG